MKSMTGFGMASVTRNGHKVSVEISSVNSKKGVDLRCICGREISTRTEMLLRPMIQERMRRGTISITVKYELSPKEKTKLVHVNKDLLFGLYEQLQDVEKEVGRQTTTNSMLSLTDLLSIPGVITESQEFPVEELLPLIEEAFHIAYAQFDSMRKTEGECLKNGLDEILSKMEYCHQTIASTLDQALTEHHQRLRDRIRLLGVECGKDDERFLKEVAFCAEKMDISEELVRLASHFSQFREYLDESNGQGRSLEFLCQEIGREINTLGAKVSSSEHAKIAIMFRNELDRLSEQVRNVE